MVRHRHEGKEWWCLPGRGVEEGETPGEAAIRELREECRVNGTVVRGFAFSARSSGYEWHAFLIDIGEQEPLLGVDPGFSPVGAVVDVRWMSSSEFEYEKDYTNVVAATQRLDVRYPVAIDNDGRTWRAYAQRYWPTRYVLDKTGHIRFKHIGEGAYEETEAVIQALMAGPNPVE